MSHLKSTRSIIRCSCSPSIWIPSQNSHFFPATASTIFSIDDRDHIHTDPTKSTKENLLEWLKDTGLEVPVDSCVTLVTFPRVLGYAFNPVSFYYIHSASGELLTAVAEVTNTYREMKLYPLGEASENGIFERLIAKDFYVSPFSDPNDSFRFRIGPPSDAWQVSINNLTDGKPTLLSSISGDQRPLTTARLAWYALKYPLLSLGIIFGIHYQALLLFLKKIPHFPKSTPIAGDPKPRPFQGIPASQSSTLPPP